ncbi:5-formyltetrahydrofolate cyclo-ligase [Desulfosediminicola ganghwensis]|uniref:5-formyltetrahydrofolate cyclo-ligase n=1 Tax=Desulfosediminicola ganghwensis TaxID=2569540 RepID=UPI0010AC48BA|nr:5-formyltetrahydrofolate cyclo-ligase [Desulfosediminicola ganghwensis]
MNDSKQLRKDILGKRDSLTRAEIVSKSSAIEQSFLSLPELSERNNIFLYVSFRSEVETLPLLHALIRLGKKVSVPITYVEERRLDAISITNPTEELTPGYCDIPEPKKEILTSNYVNPMDIDMIVLPGSVFDERCGRFGYGGGFYDRFVSANPNALRVGLAFETQIIERAPLQDHDELLDLVITEKRIIRGSRQAV